MGLTGEQLRSRGRDFAEGLDDEAHARMVRAFSWVARYLDFLHLALGRMVTQRNEFAAAARASHASPGLAYTGPPTPKSAEATARLEAALVAVAYEVEAYFQFAKILLDRAAQLVQQFFGGARGVSMNTHHNLVDHFAAFCSQKNLDGGSVRALAEQLREEVSGIRDNYIVHDNVVDRLRSTQFSPTGPVFVALRMPSSADAGGEDARTRAAVDLQADVERYIDELLSFFEEHRDKMRRQVRRTPPKA